MGKSKKKSIPKLTDDVVKSVKGPYFSPHMEGIDYYKDGTFNTLRKGVNAIIDDSASCEDMQKNGVLIPVGAVMGIFLSFYALDKAQQKRDTSEETEVKPLMVDACSDTSDIQPMVANACCDTCDLEPMMANACCDTGDLLPSMVDISCSTGDLISVADFACDTSDLTTEPPKEEVHNLINNDKCHIVKNFDEDSEIGFFERHTTGYGSKLMKKMGFNGEGLGKNGQGIKTPLVPKVRAKHEGLGYSGQASTSKTIFVNPKSPTSPKKHCCNHCGKTGHVAAKCWKLHPCDFCGCTNHSSSRCWHKMKMSNKVHIDCGWTDFTQWTMMKEMLYGFYRKGKTYGRPRGKSRDRASESPRGNDPEADSQAVPEIDPVVRFQRYA